MKENLVGLCLQNRFGGWCYKNFSIEEEAIFKTIEEENNKIKILAFVIEEEKDNLTLTPAQVKGERGLSFKQFSCCFGDIVSLLIDNIWNEIDAIWVHKQRECINK